MDTNELKSTHIALIGSLKFFDEVCRKNGIKYSLHGGTLLGAERNQGFIPWDDDADVSMMRSEYMKLKNVISELPEGTYIDEKTTWVPRLIFIVDGNTAWIDIFIWDYISSNKLAQKMKILVIRFYQGMMKEQFDYKDYNLIGRAAIAITHGLGRIVSSRSKMKQYTYFCEHCFVGDMKCIHRSNDSFIGVGQISDSDYMSEYTTIEFEGMMLMVNIRYHEFLEMAYGSDYLTPPPLEERVPSSEHAKLRKVLESRDK